MSFLWACSVFYREAWGTLGNPRLASQTRVALDQMRSGDLTGGIWVCNPLLDGNGKQSGTTCLNGAYVKPPVH